MPSRMMVKWVICLLFGFHKNIHPYFVLVSIKWVHRPFWHQVNAGSHLQPAGGHLRDGERILWPAVREVIDIMCMNIYISICKYIYKWIYILSNTFNDCYYDDNNQ